MKKIIFTAVAFSSLLIAWEGIQRVRHPQANRAYKESYYAKDYYYVKAGRFDPQLEAKNEIGATRILFVGDSTTYALPNKAEESFPFLTVKNLREKRPTCSVEMINAGVPSLTLSGVIRRMREMLYLQPDIAVVMTGYNDSMAVFGDCAVIDRRGSIRAQPPWYHKAKMALNRFLCAHSVAYMALRERIAMALYGNPNTDFQKGPNPSWARKIPKSSWATPADAKVWFKCHRKIFGRRLQEMLFLARKHHVKLVFIKAPLSRQRREELPLYAKAYFSLMEVLEEFCMRYRIPLADLTDARWEAGTGTLFQCDGLHFTKEGNTLIALLLSDFFLNHKEITERL